VFGIIEKPNPIGVGEGFPHTPDPYPTPGFTWGYSHSTPIGVGEGFPHTPDPYPTLPYPTPGFTWGYSHSTPIGVGEGFPPSPMGLNVSKWLMPIAPLFPSPTA